MICVEYRCPHYANEIPEDACDCMPIIPITDEMVERATKAWLANEFPDEPADERDAQWEHWASSVRAALAAAFTTKDEEDR